MDFAAKLIADTYAAYGRCTLSCDSCVDFDAYVDGDAVGCEADQRKVAALIAHARYDHVTPCNIVASVTHRVLDTHTI